MVDWFKANNKIVGLFCEREYSQSDLERLFDVTAPAAIRLTDPTLTCPYVLSLSWT